MDPLRGPQPGHRSAPRAGDPWQDAGEGRGAGASLTALRSFRPDLAQLPMGPGLRSPRNPSTRAARDTQARPRLGSDTRGDSQTPSTSARYREGPYTPRIEETAQRFRASRNGYNVVTNFAFWAVREPPLQVDLSFVSQRRSLSGVMGRSRTRIPVAW